MYWIWNHGQLFLERLHWDTELQLCDDKVHTVSKYVGLQPMGIALGLFCFSVIPIIEQLKCNQFEIMCSSFILVKKGFVYIRETKHFMLHSFLLLRKEGVAHMIHVCNRDRFVAKCFYGVHIETQNLNCVMTRCIQFPKYFGLQPMGTALGFSVSLYQLSPDRKSSSASHGQTKHYTSSARCRQQSFKEIRFFGRGQW